MAELTPWGAAQTRAQYAAIVRLRWRIFLNGFRRKGGKGDILSYIFLVPLFLFLIAGTASGAFFGSFAIAQSDHLDRLHLVFWGIFVVTLLVNINLGQPGTTFDPTQLIRFPLALRSYTAIRLFFGVLSPGNIMSVILSLSAAAGVITARPSLWAAALIAAVFFAIANILFTRMVFTWVDRWLSTRRAREVFTAIIFIASLGFQYWNVTYNIGGNHHHHHRHQAPSADSDQPAEDDDATTSNDAATQERIARASARYHAAKPFLDALPPGLAGNSVAFAAVQQPAKCAATAAGILAWAGAFLAIFALRMRTEFRGENLSDQANAVATPKAAREPHLPHTAPAQIIATEAHQPSALQSTQSTISAILSKEFLYVRRNTGLFYGLIAPLVMVFLFAGRMATRTNSNWIFPAALAYALLGVVPVSFNSFGLDGTGAQFFFLAPVRFRDVMLGKNLLNVAIALVEIVAVAGLVTYLNGMPPFTILFSTILWALMTLFIELTVGNYQSIRSPKRIDPGRTAQKQARPLSALLSMGILLATAGIGWSILALTGELHLAWLAPLLMLVLAAVAAVVYWRNLEGMDLYALTHRDGLFEELGKKA